MIISLFSPLCIDFYIPTLPSIRDELNGNAELSVGAFLIGLGFGQILMGALYDKKGPHIVIIASVATFIMSNALIIESNSYWSFIYYRTIQGIAVSGFALTSIALLRDNFTTQETAKYLGYLNSVINIIPSLAPFAGVWVLQQTGDWRNCFLILGIFGLLMAPWLITKTIKINHSNRNEPFTLSFIANSNYRLYSPVAIMSLSLILLYVTIVPKIFIETHQWEYKKFAIYFAANGFIMFAAGLIFAKLTKWLDVKFLFKLGTVILATSLVSLSLSTYSLEFFIAGIALHSMSFCFLISSGTALSLRSLNGNTGKAISIITCLQMIIGGTLGSFVGLLFDNTQPAFTVMVGLLLLYCIFAWVKDENANTIKS